MEAKDFLKKFLENPSICTDTRQIKNGDIYVALKGDNFDGNDFVEEALNKGTSFAITDNTKWKGHQNVIVVENTLDFLQDLAHEYRNYLDCETLAITGSNGKTTTKELCSLVLSEKYKIHATKGNFNNHIGLPLTILEAPIDTEILLLEMGANHIGEIARLCNIGRPNTGIITNIGKAHLEGFGGIKGVRKAKSELYNFLEENRGVIIYNDVDKEITSLIPANSNVVSYVKNEVLQVNPQVKIKINNNIYSSNLFGSYNATNVICSITVGLYYKVEVSEIQEAISKYLPNNNRSELIQYNGADVVLDSYNANPTSMEMALVNFLNKNKEDKVLVLGDMRELGEYAQEEHFKILKLIQGIPQSNVILVGPIFSSLSYTGFLTFQDVLAAKKYFNTINLEGKEVLIKGSRGIKLENILDR